MGQISTLIKYKLVIFIPTYNRSTLLLRTIKSAVENFPSFQIPYIVVSDSGNDDKAMAVVNDCKGNFPLADIRYFKNPQNGGIDVNMLRYLHIDMDAKYCLMLGDDDVVTPLFKNKLERYIDESFDLLVLNVNNTDEQIVELKNSNDVSRLFEMIWDKMPFGSIVINLPLAYLSSESSNKYLNTYHAYSGIIWDMITGSNSTHKIILTDGISVNYGNEIKTWSTYNYDIFINGIPLWFSLLPKQIISKEDVFQIYVKQTLTKVLFTKLLEAKVVNKEKLIEVFLSKLSGAMLITCRQAFEYYKKTNKAPLLLKIPIRYNSLKANSKKAIKGLFSKFWVI